ncbi:MAG: alpha/beta hydrolase [Candidatus Helarchaeota archaeon]
MKVRIPKNVISGAEGFFLKGSETAVMLIHGGGGGSASDMREIGEYIFEKTGYSVYVPLLPGYGTTKEELAETKVEDWLNAVTQDFQELRQEMQKVFVIGHSMGGVLALYLASEFPTEVAGVVAISAPTKLKGILIKFVPFFKLFIKYWKITDAKKFKQISNGLWVGYERIPLGIVGRMKQLIKLNNARLSQITAPILIIQGTKDQFVPQSSPKWIYEKVSSPNKTLKWFDSNHEILFSKVKVELFTSIVEWMQKI